MALGAQLKVGVGRKLARPYIEVVFVLVKKIA
jgi:hypothetical protein